MTTPETYLGAARAERFTNPMLSPGVHDFGSGGSRADELAYRGKWRIALDSATAEGGSLDLEFGARRVYLVLGSPGSRARSEVELDGKPIAPPTPAGRPRRSRHGRLERLYNLVDLPKAEDHVLELSPKRG